MSLKEKLVCRIRNPVDSGSSKEEIVSKLGETPGHVSGASREPSGRTDDAKEGRRPRSRPGTAYGGRREKYPRWTE